MGFLHWMALIWALSLFVVLYAFWEALRDHRQSS